MEQRLGCSIREYFEREGEASFRDVEQAVIDEVTQSHNGIISTGGGSVLRLANRAAFAFTLSSGLFALIARRDFSPLAPRHATPLAASR